MKKIIIAIALFLFCSVGYSATFNDLPQPVQTLINSLDVSIKFNVITNVEEQTDFNKYTVNLLLFKDASTCESNNYIVYYDKTTSTCYWLNNTPQPINVPAVESFTDKIMTWSNGDFIEIIKTCEAKKQAIVKLYIDDDSDLKATAKTVLVKELDNGDIKEVLEIQE